MTIGILVGNSPDRIAIHGMRGRKDSRDTMRDSDFSQHAFSYSSGSSTFLYVKLNQVDATAGGAW